MAQSHDVLITLEDNTVVGGAGSAINECLISHGVQVPVMTLGLPDRFLDHGSREQLLEEAGLDSSGIIESIRSLLHRRDCENSGTRVIS